MNRKKLLSQLTSAQGIAIVCGFLCAMAAHAFALVHNLYNYDGIAQQPSGYGTGIESGRWFLSLLGDATSFLEINYNLPWVNGVIFLLLLAVAAGFLVKALGIRNRGFAALVGMILAVFPTVTSTMYFRYTAVYYGVGILFAVLAAWVLERSQFGLLFSALLTALSLGIYQAYTPITIGIFVLQLMRLAVEEEITVGRLFRTGLKDCAALILGLLFYFVFLKGCLWLYGVSLLDYQGISEMGNISAAELPRLIYEALYDVVMLPFRSYANLVGMKMIRVLYLALELVTAALGAAVWLIKIRKWPVRWMFLALAAVFPLSVNFIRLMCPNSWIYTTMVYAFALIPCCTLVLMECLMTGENKPCAGRSKAVKAVVSVILLLLVFFYGYEANIGYNALYFANIQVENYCNNLITQIRMTQGFEPDKKWAFVGKIDDPLLHCYWQYETRYGGSEFTQALLNRESLEYWIQCFTGYSPEFATEEEKRALEMTPEYEAMPCWPSQGSIGIINDMVVVKFSDS